MCLIASNVRTYTVTVFQHDGFVMAIMTVEICLMNRTAPTDLLVIYLHFMILLV